MKIPQKKFNRTKKRQNNPKSRAKNFAYEGLKGYPSVSRGSGPCSTRSLSDKTLLFGFRYGVGPEQFRKTVMR